MPLKSRVSAILFGFLSLFSEASFPSSNFTELAQDYENSLFEYSPELGLFWGRSEVALDRFTDTSSTGYAGWLKQEDAFLARLNILNPKDLADTPEYTTYLLLKETLEAKKASRICREELWDINPTFGWHNKMAIIAEKQPIGTKEYRQLALTRWKTFDKAVENQIDNLKLGVKLGYTAPKPAVKRVLAQLHMIIDSPIDQSPYFDFARRDTDAEFKKAVSKLMTDLINPALNKYVHYLEEEYLPSARVEIGVAAIPGGRACYQAKLQEETSLDFSPRDIHNLGLETMQKIAEEVAEIGLKRYGIQDMTDIFERAKNESTDYFSTEDEVLQYNLRALERAKTKLADWFDIMPKTEGIVKAYPAFRAKTGASGEYHPPNETGTEPGIFYINADEPVKKSRIDLEATLFHELIPGHHFQIALMYENKALPRLNRYLLSSGFAEGWALYVERLADEMGLYQDEISRLGMLSNEALRAARLVVDTGIHAFYWSRKKAVTYLKQHTALSDAIIEGEVDRYIMMPAQATAYFLGKNTIERLRDEAKEQLGTRFDIRQFHNEILRHGAISLPILEMQVGAWINGTKLSCIKKGLSCIFVQSSGFL